jgi:CheY-like chemotaxis protein
MAKLVIAEDNPFVAAFLHEAVRESGYELCGVATSAAELMELAERHKPDLAVIDVRLADGSSGIKAAVALASLIDVGILFATASPERVIDPPAPVGAACLRKPFTGPELIEALRIVEQIVATGQPPAEISPKLRLLERAHAPPQPATIR